MIYEELPGVMIYADFAPGSWLLHFAKAPWPVWAAAAEMRRVTAFEWGLQWFWWQKHRALREPSPELRTWLARVLAPERDYRPAEVVRALVQAGCANGLMERELFSQRLLLMPSWNRWPAAMPGHAYLEGRHHESRPLPAGLPRFKLATADQFVTHSHLAQLLNFLDWSAWYSLEQLQHQVRRVFAGPMLCPLLEKVAATWAASGELQAAQWVLALHLEIGHSSIGPRT